ncbi:dethiobiotin synthase [Alcanivorax sp. S71-1-4]|uniref:dethiobiotin synthase n=1 Tax=Alcanivorax sp. S71-1-4 TaxID=1177159 RepID=UPI001356A871|nr:dethiobiotin synthase [Alcanivorax sp. S71-1-4]KAF0808273.1 dethiobiotin synthase [Alcanivorax sp. S71-1-4]
MTTPLTGKYFLTGTDTEVGKTWVSCRLLEQARDAGLSALGLKPVAAGAEQYDGQWQNDDARQLMAASSVPLPYEQVNPVLLREPMAPHLAARHEQRMLSVSRIAGYVRGVMMQKQDLLLVEGAGGWRVPLNDRETLAELAVALRLPVILVVGMRLGCLNHALLTAEAIQRDGLRLAGWVANVMPGDAMAGLEENIATLEHWLPAPRILL